MILKSMSRRSGGGGLMKYIFRYILDKDKMKEKEEQQKKSRPFIIKHNIRSNTVAGFIREFMENEAYRLVNRKDSVKMFHTILSFSNKDTLHITDKLLRDMAEKFIQERGVNNLYVGTKHQDKDHVHIHLAISGTQLNGYSSRISKQQLHHIKLELDKYQREKYPELKHSLPEHGKSKHLTKETVIEAAKQQHQTQKVSVIESVQQAYATAKSLDQFLAQLAQSGHEVYYRNRNLQGVIHEGQKFRFSNLGYDKTAFQELDAKEKEEIQLTELEQIRNHNSKKIEKTEMKALNENETEIQPIDATLATESPEDKAMQELQELRGSSNEQNLNITLT